MTMKERKHFATPFFLFSFCEKVLFCDCTLKNMHTIFFTHPLLRLTISSSPAVSFLREKGGEGLFFYFLICENLILITWEWSIILLTSSVGDAAPHLDDPPGHSGGAGHYQVLLYPLHQQQSCSLSHHEQQHLVLPSDSRLDGELASASSSLS